MKRILIALAAAAVISAQFCMCAWAEQTEKPALISPNPTETQDENTPSEKMTVNFTASAPDENGVFKLKVSFDEMRFTVYRFALRYDPKVVEPYNEKGSKAAEKFAEFALPIQHTGLSRIGETLYSDQGLIDFTGYALKAGGALDETSMFTWDGIEAVTQDNVVLYEFTFRKKQDEKVKFELAMADGNGAYVELFPEGASVLGPNSQYSAKAVFTYELGDDKQESSTTEFDSQKYANTPGITKAERLKDTLYMQNGNYACAVDGALCIIDSGNKAVAPIIKDDQLFVPLRFASEKFGFGVEWDDSQRKALVRGTENHWQVFEIYPDNGRILNQGQAMEGATPFILNDRIYVQARYIEQMLGVGMYALRDVEAVVFYKGENWLENRYAEKEAVDAMQFVVSPFVKMFG